MEHPLAGVIQYAIIALFFFLSTLLAYAAGKHRARARRRALEQLEGQPVRRALPEEDSRRELILGAGWIGRGESVYTTRAEVGECTLTIGKGAEQSLTFELMIEFAAPSPIDFDLTVKLAPDEERAPVLVHEPDPERGGERVEDWMIVSTAARGHVLLAGDYQRCEARGLFEAIFASNRIMPHAARFDLRVASLELDATRVRLVGSTSRVNPLNFYFARKRRAREIAKSLGHDLMTLVTTLKQATHEEAALLTRMSEARGLHERTREVVASWRDSKLDAQALHALRMRHVQEKMIPEEAGERELEALLQSARKEDALGVLLSESRRPSGARLRNLFLRIAPELIAARLDEEALDEWMWFAMTEPDEAMRRENLDNGHHLLSANVALDKRVPTRMRIKIFQKIMMERDATSLPAILETIISAPDLDAELLERAYIGAQAILPDWHVTALVELAREYERRGSRVYTERALALLATFHADRAGVMRTPEFEVLLCELLEDPHSHARRLLRGVGGVYTLQLLTHSRSADHAMLDANAREQLCDAIRARLGGAEFGGAVSLAASARGGELSQAADTGSLEVIDD